MKRRHLPWIATAILVVLVGAIIVWENLGAARTMEEIAAQELQLVRAKCTQPESVDRWLLQQSWFYDQHFTELAGGFGQSSFSLYEKGDAKRKPVEGAFCINGNTLVVRYFNRRAVPIKLRLNDLAVDFGTKLVALGEDTYTVRELTKKRMVLMFASDGHDHEFYRKN
jgi:hypothetical protein